MVTVVDAPRQQVDFKKSPGPQEITWIPFGDLEIRLSNWPCGAYYGMLFGLVWDAKWTYEVN